MTKLKIRGKFTAYYKMGKIHEIELSVEELAGQLTYNEQCSLINALHHIKSKPTEPNVTWYDNCPHKPQPKQERICELCYGIDDTPYDKLIIETINKLIRSHNKLGERE